MSRRAELHERLEARARQFLCVRVRADPIDWARANVRIHDKESEFKGAFSTEAAPDMVEVLRTMCGTEYEKSVVVGPAQSFKTTLLIAGASYILCNDPGAITWVMDATPNARAFSKRRWQPTVEASPALRELKPTSPHELTNLELSYTTATLRFAGSNSPGKVASFPAKLVIGDEVDKYPQRLKSEAGTLELVCERSKMSTQHWHWFASTPTVAHGKIWLEAHKGDMRRLWMPCPHCGKMFIPHREHLRWAPEAELTKGSFNTALVEQTAHLVCPSPECAQPIYEHHRRAMLNAARWIPEDPVVAQALRDNLGVGHEPGTASFFRTCFHILHPNTTLGKIAAKWTSAGRDPSAVQNVINSWFGDVYEEPGTTVEADAIKKRAEDYCADAETPGGMLTVPEGVVVMVATVDLQEDRMEAEMVGFGVGEESWGLEYKIVLGSPTKEETWKKLEEWLTRRWQHPSGAILAAAAVVIDSSYLPEYVYKFVGPRLSRRYFAVKGSSSAAVGEPIVSRPRKSGVKLVPLFVVGTGTSKDMVYSRLRIAEPGPGYMHFPSNPKRGYDLAYYRGLTAEKCIKKRMGGGIVRTYINPSKRPNEPLDLRGYSFVALALLNPDLEALAEKLNGLSEPEPVVPELPAEESATTEFDPATGKITREAGAEPAPVAAPEPPLAPANTYQKPSATPTANRPAPQQVRRIQAPRRNFATSW